MLELEVRWKSLFLQSFQDMLLSENYLYRVLTWIRNQSRVFPWIRHLFFVQVDDLSQNAYYCSVFNEFGVCVCVSLEPVSYSML